MTVVLEDQVKTIITAEIAEKFTGGFPPNEWAGQRKMPVLLRYYI